MKSLTDYTEKEVSEVFEKHGAFWAFGTKQFEEKAVKGVEYCTVLGGGDCIPKENAKQFHIDLSNAYKNGRERHLAEVGLENIIKHELANHECYYTGDWMTAFWICEDYGATKEQVYAIYVEESKKNSN